MQTARSPKPRPRIARALALALVVGGCVVSGCSYSGDRHPIESTTWSPKTMTLYDTRTSEPVWAVDIPVGYKLIVAFEEGAGPNEYNSAIIKWEVMESERNQIVLSNRQACPGKDVRKLEMTLRDTPEMPGAALPGSPFEG